MTHPLSGLMTQKETLSSWVDCVQKYFAALIGSDGYIYNYYVLPKESGVYRMGYTVESSFCNVAISHEHVCRSKNKKDLMQ